MSFNTGLLGLRAAQMDLSVTGNNIANASTKGFKQSRAEFGDVYASSMLGNGSNKPGSGVLVERISQEHSQGGVDYTGRALDMMIDGNGYFKLSDNGQEEYTRAGYFDLDKEGYITNNTGKRLQGYNADDEGSIIAGAPQDIQLSQDSLAAKATTKIDVAFNFDSRKPSLEIANFNPNDRTTYTEANRSSVFDSLGKEHELTQYFIKVPSSDENGEGDEGVNGNTWAVVTAFDGQFIGAEGEEPLTVIGAEGEEPLTAKNWVKAENLDIEKMTQATMVFNTQGRLTGYHTGYSTAINEEGLPANGDNAGEGEEGEAQASPLSFTITLPPAPPTEGNAGNIDGAFVGGFNGQNAGNNKIAYNLAGTTQYGAGYSAQSQYQNGYTAGSLSGLEVDGEGTIIGRYSNGEVRDVGQVPVFTFRNPEGLKPNGSTAWLETSESGDALPNSADLGITGSIIGGALEESNVDIAEELVKMIIGQRNYQANAKTIQTQDTITQTIINLR
ncbi:MAG TPA: flagellar hook protein FlgE [Marinospirillum sp.]|uniref:flagellar hook protein FlgE n=1 Tax=Marinospirillum sp. TaxID=2183934 RepID=UPI002B4A9172|nr:flagellar hook protein FlgE [Marinospirillum sp.]HKM15874.1 flagellar hook protein FlgE [Marinospirillum sp.]